MTIHRVSLIASAAVTTQTSLQDVYGEGIAPSIFLVWPKTPAQCAALVESSGSALWQSVTTQQRGDLGRARNV